ncbi:MAG: hypothetical protein K2L88_00530, partial [Clostridiales bacterium]|nr:hypothetical protein [Clostridiales bacterium]
NGTYMMGYQPAWYGRGQWWLRSPIWDSAVDLSIGTPSGAVSGSKVDSATVGIVPAMRVSASVLA